MNTSTGDRRAVCWPCADTGGTWHHHHDETGHHRVFAYCEHGCEAARVRWLLNLICDQAAAYHTEAEANRADRLRRSRSWADEIAGKGAA